MAEVAVVASPDRDRGHIVKAFIRLRAKFTQSNVLSQDLQELVKTRLASYKFPREIEYVKSFELTSSGKINRKVLRLKEELLKGLI